MKLNPLVGSLSLYDMVGTHGVATDLSHVNTKAAVTVRERRSRARCGVRRWRAAVAVSTARVSGHERRAAAC